MSKKPRLERSRVSAARSLLLMVRASSAVEKALRCTRCARRSNAREYLPGTAITRNGDSTYTVTDGASSFGFAVPDFDVRSLRSNIVLRWEWQPGSTLYLVWQQSRFSRGVPHRA